MFNWKWSNNAQYLTGSAEHEMNRATAFILAAFVLGGGLHAPCLFAVHLCSAAILSQ